MKWLKSERRAWEWPQDVTPSQWAEQERYLPPEMTNQPGMWDNRVAPYLQEIMDAAVDPVIEMIVCVKPAQVGWSEALRNVLGFWIDRDPGPALIVMPDQNSAEELLSDRVKPLIEKSPAVRRHMRGALRDMKRDCIKLDTMAIYLGWSGSSQTLKSRPIRYVLLEEPDEYKIFSGKGGDPISKAIKRTTRFGRRAKVYLGGTPTIPTGNVWVHWEECGDHRYFHIPCPHCKKYQRVVFGSEGDGPGLKWEKTEGTRAERSQHVIEHKTAYYRCENGCKIEEISRQWMLERGHWLGEGQTITNEGVVIGARKKAVKVGYQISALYCPWLPWAKLVGEFILAKANRESLEDFVNQRLAEPFDEMVIENKVGIIKNKRELGPKTMPLLPDWTQVVIATADAQMGWFKLHIGAWGYNYKYQGLSEIVVRDNEGGFDALQKLSFGSRFRLPGPGERYLSARCLIIDSGGTKEEGARQSRTNEVYQFAMRDRTRIIPTKGASITENMTRPWVMSKLPNGVVLIRFNTTFYKDLLYRIVTDEDQVRWMPAPSVTDQYCGEMVNEHKVLDRKSGKIVWKKRHSGDRVEAWDCEVLQCLGADMANLGFVPAPGSETASAAVAVAASAEADGSGDERESWTSGARDLTRNRPMGWSKE